VASGAQVKQSQEMVLREIEIRKALQTAGVSDDLAIKIDSGTASATDMARLNPTQFKAAGQLITFRINQQNANTQQKLAELKAATEGTRSGRSASDMSFLKSAKAEAHKSYTDLDTRIQMAKLMEEGEAGLLARMGINLADMEFERKQAKASYDRYSKISDGIIKEIESGGASKKFTPATAPPAAGMVKVRNKKGVVGSIPKSQLPAALKSGYTQVK